MLSAPGGLFLDVKSAYSSALDLQLFCAVLAGIGVHVKVIARPNTTTLPSLGRASLNEGELRKIRGIYPAG